MEEDIKILKEVDFNSNEKQKALENILSELEQLQEENEELKRQENIRNIEKYNEIEINELIRTTFRNNFINEDKVKEKIEELKQEDEEYTNELSEPDSNFKVIDRNLKRIKNQIDILKELIRK